MDGDFEERYRDVLQNIEFGIVQVYREHREMTDWHAESAVEALLHAYEREAQRREIRHRSLDPLAEEAYVIMRAMCDWRLGRESVHNEDGEPVRFPGEALSLAEIIACLKRIRKSIRYWTKQAGRQGYLRYVDQFIL
jgi:hypothetical protein